MNNPTYYTRPRKLASVPEYTPIPQDVLDKGWRPMVHVEGWRASCRFAYIETAADGTHTICSSKGRYQTKNRLLYTKRYQPCTTNKA